ncbi:MAG: hypothetical protein O3B13_04335 [Planctomycetota bacterium]|nr:hypothetical protein [Planctomycetota bacterium]
MFFTVARQIRITYILPGLPGMAVLLAVSLIRWIACTDSASQEPVNVVANATSTNELSNKTVEQE